MTLEERVREIVYKDDFFKQYAAIVPEVGERLEAFVFSILSLIEDREKVAVELLKPFEEVSTTSETPGVQKDEQNDDLIFRGREALEKLRGMS